MSMRTRGDAHGCNLSPTRFYALSNYLTEHNKHSEKKREKKKEKKKKERELLNLLFYVYMCNTVITIIGYIIIDN